MIKVIIGVLCILAGVVLGLYVGVWLFFIGGIINIVHGAQATPADSGKIAWGAVQAFLLPEIAGAIAFWLCAGIGAVFITSSDKW